MRILILNIHLIFFSIDATEDRGQFGRMMNHSRKAPNMVPQLYEDISETPHVCFFTNMAVGAGDELLYDYGDHSFPAIKAHPWLSQ